MFELLLYGTDYFLKTDCKKKKKTLKKNYWGTACRHAERNGFDWSNLNQNVTCCGRALTFALKQQLFSQTAALNPKLVIEKIVSPFMWCSR